MIPREHRSRPPTQRASPAERPRASPTAGAKVIRGSVLRSGAYGATVMLGILSAALMTRHLGVAAFGQYVTVLSIVTVATGLSDVGMSNIGVREYSVREGATATA